MAMKDKQGNWLDDKGRPIPEEYVKPIDKKRDKLVESIIKRVTKLSAKLADEKVEIVAAVEKYLKELAKDSKVREGWKGNIILYNFSQNLCIERRINETISFDERLQMVKTTIDKWLNERLRNVDEVVAKLISQAFSVDKQGRINTTMLLKLKKLDIKDKEWVKALPFQEYRCSRRWLERVHPQLQRYPACNGGSQGCRTVLRKLSTSSAISSPSKRTTRTVMQSSSDNRQARNSCAA